jgi:hypothetical protein
MELSRQPYTPAALPLCTQPAVFLKWRHGGPPSGRLCLMGTSQMLYSLLCEGSDYIIRMEDETIPKIALNGKFLIQGQWEKQEQDGRTSS